MSFGFDEWSRFRLNANNLTTDQGMVLDAALNEARDYLFRNGHPNVTWADALVEICRRSLTTAGTQRAERFKTYIHINPPTSGSSIATSTATDQNPATATSHTVDPDSEHLVTDHDDRATTTVDDHDDRATTTVDDHDDHNTHNRHPDHTFDETNTIDPPADRTYPSDPSDPSDPSGLGGRGVYHEGPASPAARALPNHVSFDAILTNGIPIPPTIRDYLTCDTLIQIIWQQGHLPIGVGNTTRTPPNRLRRLLELRHQGCAIPGCNNTLGLQAHHITPWQAGGVTELANLVLVCDAHHHQHHTGDITITGNPQLPLGQPGALTITDQHGRTLRTHPTPRPPHPDDRPTNPRYKHPSGETCDYRYLTWQPIPAA